MPGMPAELSYDRARNIVFMSFPDYEELKTQDEIAAHFDRVVSFWRVNAGGKKSYFIVDFDNVMIDIKELEFYAQQTKRAHEICAITSIRYGGSPPHPTATPLPRRKNPQPSAIHETLARRRS